MQSLRFTFDGKPYRLDGDKLTREAYSKENFDYPDRLLTPQDRKFGQGYILGRKFFYIHQIRKLAV